MKKNVFIRIVFLVGLVIVFHHSFAANIDPRWASKMRKLVDAYSELAPYIYSESRFHDPKNAQPIEKAMKDFVELSHKVNLNAKSQEYIGDPSLALISQRLEEDAEQALTAFRDGNLHFSRSRIRSVTRSCFQCHSRMPDGPELIGSTMQIKGDWIAQSEVVDVLVATRQFDAALEKLNSIFSDSAYIASHPLEYQKSIRKFLAIAVRVKQEPDLAMQMINQINASKVAPEFVKEDSKIWRSHILSWKTEKRKAVPSLEVARSLIESGKNVQKFPMDNRGDVLYLRASALLHEYLLQKHSKNDTAEAYYLLGSCYEILREAGQWFLHETYFEACVRSAPKTKWAKLCYHRYEMSTYVGYSGSGGVFLPDAIKEKLNELKKIAF